ncbi:MAG: hypothetical protein A2X94_08800 [Bdellovibrionales bacterium GWB1_55_8]|nr:MAG: hypothetical protein A2X94_08800 [Bdellovibrionales bacterium GWB1_55_8]
MKLRQGIVFLFILFCAFSETEQAAADTARTARPFGFYVGAASEPWPSILSINLAYNVLDQLRITAGTGTMFFGSSQGAGIKYIAMPEKPVSLIAGINVARTRISDFLSGGFGLQPGADEIMWNTNVNFGIDWQAQNGFNLGAGLTWMNYQDPADTIGTTVFPYLNIGWFY